MRLILLGLLCVTLSGCTVRDGRIFINFPSHDGGGKNVDPKPDVKAVRVMIVEETNDRPTLPGPQAAILSSKEVRDYFKAHCCKGADGKTPEYRIVDKDDDVGNLSAPFQEVFKRPRASTPWFYVTNGAKGTEGPLPEDSDRFLQIIKPYCENQ